MERDTKFRVYADGEIVHQDEFDAKDLEVPYTDDYTVYVVPDSVVNFIQDQLTSTVNRHKELIDRYMVNNTYLIDSEEDEGGWRTLTKGVEPKWLPCRDYMLHPHNSLIIAHTKGARIQVFDIDGVSTEPYWYNDPNPTWDLSLLYRVHPDNPMGIKGCA